MHTPYAAVCGGANLDIGGIPAAPLVERDSNPGRVVRSAGGVGRNIAAGIARLGLEVTMLTALGEDHAADAIRAGSPGVDFSHALILPHRSSSTYLYLTDETGDMVLAVNDMAVTNCLTPAYFETKLDVLNDAAAVVLDANLPEESLRYLAEHVTAPLVADPVSTVKGMKLLPLLDRLSILKPNRLESQALTGKDCPEEAVKALLDAGVKRVYLSMGAAGVCCGGEAGIFTLPVSDMPAVNTTGAGDAFTGALTTAFVRGMGLEESARFAMDCVMKKLQTEALKQ